MLKEYVIKKLNLRWSPIAIAGRWSKENLRSTITAEAIYQFVYNPKNKHLELCKLLPRRKPKRGLARKTHSRGGILHRISIHQRPAEIKNRKEGGHFEIDLFFHKGNQSSNVLAAVDRKSRYAITIKNSSKNSAIVMQQLIIKIGTMAKSATFDNGTEFAQHMLLREKAIQTYFCDPGAPWQKGSAEHFIGMTRRYIPFKIPSRLVSQTLLDSMVYSINHTPRKILNFKTPCEVFSAEFQKEIERCCT